jgi:hypothetical protein
MFRKSGISVMLQNKAVIMGCYVDPFIIIVLQSKVVALAPLSLSNEEEISEQTGWLLVV